MKEGMILALIHSIVVFSGRASNELVNKKNNITKKNQS